MKNAFYIDYSFINIFNRIIPSYGILFFIGILFAAVIAICLCRISKISLIDLVCSSVFCFVGALIGSKLVFLLVSAKQIIELHIPPIAFIKGGFVFYGGLLGGAMGIIIYARKYKLPVSNYTDLFSAVLPIGHAFGRIGCFFGGCCYGMKYIGPFAVVYRSSADLNTPINTPLLPVQLISSIALFILGVTLIILYTKNSSHNFFITSVYLISYGIGRFLIEFLRGDAERGTFIFLSTSQWISVCVLTVGFIILLKYRKSFRNDSKKTISI